MNSMNKMKERNTLDFLPLEYKYGFLSKISAEQS